MNAAELQVAVGSLRGIAEAVLHEHRGRVPGKAEQGGLVRREDHGFERFDRRLDDRVVVFAQDVV